MPVKHFFVICLVFLCTSCLHEYTADILDPGIAAYSTEGKNSAGAYVDGTLWNTEKYCLLSIFGSNCIPEMKIRVDTVNNDMLLRIAGGIDMPDDAIDEYFTIYFYLANRNIRSMEGILDFSNSEIILDGYENYGGICIQGNNELCTNGSGKLFINGSKIWLDELGESRYVLSGTFGFDMNPECEYSEIHKGRFDFTISAEDIFVSADLGEISYNCM